MVQPEPQVRLTTAFRSFVEDARAALGRQDESSLFEQFSSFIAATVPVLATTKQFEQEGPLASEVAILTTLSFQKFISAAAPLVVRRVVYLLPAIRARVLLSSRWLLTDDLLSVAGFGFVENAYTELMAWALDPDTHPPTALDRQRLWFDSINLKTPAFSIPARPQTQVWTNDGIPDLVLVYDGFAVVLETKTGSKEHPTPSGRMQTLSYPEVIRERTGLPVHVIFITPNRAEAENPNAVTTTFSDFGLAMAEAMAMLPTGDEKRFSYAMLITHFITQAHVAGVSVREPLVRLSQWFEHDKAAEATDVLKRLPDLLAVMSVFGLE